MKNIKYLVISTQVRILLTLTVMCFLVNQGYAQTQQSRASNQISSHEVTLKEGLSAFKQKKYRQAASLFKQALNSAPENKTIRYNLAMSLIKLEQYKQGRQLLRDLYLENVRHAPLLYSLAITEKKLGRNEKANVLFKRVANSSNPTLSLAAKKQIQALSSATQVKTSRDKSTRTNKTKSGKPRTFSAKARIGGGHDDGVVDVVNDLVKNGDDFNDFIFYGNWKSKARSSEYWFATASTYVKRYSDLDRFDYDRYAIDFGRSSKYWGGNFRNSMRLDTSRFGGNAYLESVSLSSRYSRRLNQTMLMSFLVRAKSSESLNLEFDHLAGESYLFENALTFKPNRKHRFSFKYRFEHRDRGDLERNTNSSLSLINLSADRHSATGSWRYKIGSKLELYTRAAIRYSDFNNSFIISNQANSREDTRLTFSSELKQSLTDNISASIGYRHIDNHSSLDVYTFERDIFYLRFELSM